MNKVVTINWGVTKINYDLMSRANVTNDLMSHANVTTNLMSHTNDLMSQKYCHAFNYNHVICRFRQLRRPPKNTE